MSASILAASELKSDELKPYTVIGYFDKIGGIADENVYFSHVIAKSKDKAVEVAISEAGASVVILSVIAGHHSEVI